MRRTLVAASFASCISACGGFTLPDEPPSVDGTVLVFSTIPQPSGEPRSGTLRVGRTEPPCDMIEVYFELGNQILVRRPDGSVVNAVENDFRFGRRVRVWTDAPVDTCPWEGRAEAVEVFAE